MKKTTTLSLTIITLGLLNTITASALTFQNNANVEFTLNPTINITLSSNDLIIDNLAPGSASDSNIITATVSTNAGWGYYLSATANTSGGNTNLTHETSSTDVFTSLSSNAPDLPSMPDNTWGYSYCNNTTDCSNSTNWISGDTGSAIAGYNGLPLDGNDSGATGVKLLSTNSFSTSTSSIKFKIGAKAANTQAAGTYNGTVNFYAVTYRGPTTFDDAFASAGKTKYLGYYKMQDMTKSICDSVEVYDESGQTKLIDVRDNKTYWVTKLQDNNCWMTQNLDLSLTSGVALTSDTTDLTTSGTAPYIVGYENTGGTISWTPQDWTSTSSATISATTRTPNGNRFDDWVNGTDEPGDNQYKDGYIHPLSANPGDWYETGTYFNSVNCNYLGVNCANFSTTPYASNGTHGHVGNYYNWTAAIASNDSDGINSGSQQNSVCPKGWMLPVNGKYGTLNDIYNDAHTGAGEQGWDSGLFGAPLYLIRAGDISGSLLHYSGYNGLYWSSTVNSSARTRRLDFQSTNISPASSSYRYLGFSLRCHSRPS